MSSCGVLFVIWPVFAGKTYIEPCKLSQKIKKHFVLKGFLTASRPKGVQTLLCLLFSLLLLAFSPGAAAQTVEICDNAIDDDLDGLIDLNDPDCDCPLLEPVSLIPNPSFEEADCCPNSRSQLGCATGWIQASEPTTDLIHDCGWLGWDDYPPPRPFPDGEGIMGFRDGRPPFMEETVPVPNWKEYAGACLVNPLIAGNRYRFEFDLGFSHVANSPPINVTFYGATDCANLPFGVGEVDLGCPTNGPGWVRLGTTNVRGGNGNQWVKAGIEVTPTEDILAIAIGPECQERPSQVSLYYFFDNLLLADFESFQFKISGTAHPCSDAFALQLPARENLSYQWYLEGVALVGEITPMLSRMYGFGQYVCRVEDSDGCRVTPAYNHQVFPIERETIVTICAEEIYPFGARELTEPGSYIDTFKSVNNCDSIVNLDLRVLVDLADTISGKIFVGEAFEVAGRRLRTVGNHTISLPSSIGCDSLVMVDIEHYNVYFPTAFSPNGDGVNDRYEVSGNEDLLEVLEVAIYDRWGSLLSSGLDWDGTDNGRKAAPGVYVYRVRLLMDDGGERAFAGSMMLMR